MSMRLDDLLNLAVFGTATEGTDITIAATITNINAVIFELENVHLHVQGGLDDVGDLVQYPEAGNYADVPTSSLSFADLPKSTHTHGTLTDSQGRSYTIQSVDQHGSLLRMDLSSQLL